jgi:hypothetical protein
LQTAACQKKNRGAGQDKMGLLSLVLLVTNVSFAVVRNRLRACEVPCLVLDRTRLSLCAGG